MEGCLSILVEDAGREGEEIEKKEKEEDED